MITSLLVGGGPEQPAIPLDNLMASDLSCSFAFALKEHCTACRRNLPWGVIGIRFPISQLTIGTFAHRTKFTC